MTLSCPFPGAHSPQPCLPYLVWSLSPASLLTVSVNPQPTARSLCHSWGSYCPCSGKPGVAGHTEPGLGAPASIGWRPGSASSPLKALASSLEWGWWCSLPVPPEEVTAFTFIILSPTITYTIKYCCSPEDRHGFKVLTVLRSSVCPGWSLIPARPLKTVMGRLCMDTRCWLMPPTMCSQGSLRCHLAYGSVL